MLDVFILLFDRGRQEGVLEFVKHHLFLVFLTVWDLFPESLGKLKGLQTYSQVTFKKYILL